LEITAEITKEEYRSFVKNYYLEKNWVRWIALLVIVALMISISMNWSHYGRWFFWTNLHAFFSFTFFMLALIFFVIPYGYAYNMVRVKLKKEDDQTGTMVYQVTDTGITTAKNGVSLNYLWGQIDKVKVLTDFIVFISLSDDMLVFPVSALPNGDSGSLLQLINGYNVFKIVLTKEKGIN